MAPLATLTVDLVAQTGRFQRQMRASVNSTKQLDRAARRVGAAIAGMFAARQLGRGVRQLASITGEMFTLGSAAIETRNKFNEVFGDQADAVRAFNSEFVQTAGIAKATSADIVATTGAIAQGLGFARAESATFAIQIQRLAGDLASFNNLPTAETARAIQSAVVGEREQLKRLGIVVREVDVQQRALLNTGETSVKNLTEQSKALATLQLINERAGAAVGDLGRTANETANVVKQLAASWIDLKTQIGKFIAQAPMVQAFLVQTRDMIRGMIGVIQRDADTIREAFELLGLAAANAFSVGIITGLDIIPGRMLGFLDKVRDDAIDNIAEIFRTIAILGGVSPGAVSVGGASTSGGGVRGLPPLGGGGGRGAAAPAALGNFADLQRAAFAPDREAAVIRDFAASTRQAAVAAGQFKSILDDVEQSLERSGKAAIQAAARTQQLIVAVIQSVGAAINALLNARNAGGVFGGLLGIAGGVVGLANPIAGAALGAGGALIAGLANKSQDPVAVRIADFSDRALQQQAGLGPTRYEFVFLDSEGQEIYRIERGLRDLTARDGRERLPAGVSI